MFSAFERLNVRPAPFSVYTADLLWTDPHVSAQMLAHHLDGTVDVSSRTTETISRSLRWLTGPLGVGAGTRVLDLGCGPGLYTNPLAAVGAEVTGVDFSERSLRHAAATAPDGPGEVTYVHGNYLDVPLPGTFDIALMIFCDFCALSPGQRGLLLDRVVAALVSGGRFVLDVCGLGLLGEREEGHGYTACPEGGFWSAQPYFEFRNTHVYGTERVLLDRYEIVEAHRTRAIYNWLQCYDVESLTEELGRHGLAVAEVFGDVTGAPYVEGSSEFAVVAVTGA